MRKILLASAAILGATGGLALAQTAPNPMSGKMIAPLSGGPAANNNNNSWGTANTPTGSAAAGPTSFIYSPNTVAVPDPGTVVIRLNGRVEVDLGAYFTSVDKGVGATGAGFKLSPVNFSSYMRLYPGFDGRATNGIRYGAAIELRENFGTATAPAQSSSGFSSTETVFVRRAFSYLASDQAGIVRFGQTDGVLGLFDNCVFTSACWDAGVGNFNGGGMQSSGPQAAVGVPFVWLSQAGAEYTNTKIVYLSPQFFGFDFGAQYAPNMGNNFASGGCVQASATCHAVTSGNDPTRWLNQVGVGLRYQQAFGAVDVKAYGFYEAAGKENLTTAAYTAPSKAGNTATFRYDNLSFYKAGVAITALNTTFAADYIGGAINGQLAMRPTGGVAMNALVTGVTFRNGPITLGAEVGVIDSQGDARLTGVSQRREYEIAFGGNYALAPGVALVGEYMYTNRHQGGFDFAQGAVSAAGLTRDAKAQGLLFSTVLTW